MSNRLMRNPNYVTPDEFLKAVRRAYEDVYCGENTNRMNDPWHPADIADNTITLIEAMKSYATEILEQRRPPRPFRQ